MQTANRKNTENIIGQMEVILKDISKMVFVMVLGLGKKPKILILMKENM